LSAGIKSGRCLCFKKDSFNGGGLACTDVYQPTIVDCVTDRAVVTVTPTAADEIVYDANIITNINYGDIRSQFNIDPACFAATPDAKHAHYYGCETTPTLVITADYDNGETEISYPLTA
jgi:hypothetical protein